ncbi:hypothetical protein [Rhodobaculum claviforme]|uniref:Uncharacterized protein n=1 Tax=Rhodobaculum claviforme TaxID=1549854 RepID=A0A934TJC0_9RHOB|nr:hypothetical protein [Rhodobaculum claviforme]MBK5927154.1 hypothetical protein [Rhodobaculum claviforme]
MSVDRLARMISSRGLTEENRRAVMDRLNEASVDPGDPLAVMFVMELAMARMPEAMARRMRAELSDRNSQLVASLRDTVRDTLGDAAAEAARDLRHRAARNLAALAVVASTVLVGLGIAWGAQLGLDRRSGFLEMLAAHPEAETWATLIAANPSVERTIAEDCAPDSTLFLPQTDSRPACLVPLWIDKAPAPTPEAFPARVMTELRHRVTTAPGWLFLAIGVLGTLAVQPLIRWIRRNDTGHQTGR